MSETATDPDGLELLLGKVPPASDPFGNSRCCGQARYVENHKGDGPFGANPGKYACVCLGKSYCPEHGIRCNGSHD